MSQADPVDPVDPVDHQVLFVAGLARSGTTALHRVLDAHPDVALGIERYKRLWGGRIGEIDERAFDRDRFFDWSEDLTNITPDLGWAARQIAALDAKWDTARHRGDKMTTVRAQKLWQTIPEARFVFIVRDVAEVAASWERRARNEADLGWRRDLGAEAAVAASNTALRRIRRAVRQRPEHACVVHHQSFFADPDATALRGVCAFLGLDADPVLGAFAAAHQTYVDSVVSRERVLPSEVAAFVEAQADRRAWRDVVALAL